MSIRFVQEIPADVTLKVAGSDDGKYKIELTSDNHKLPSLFVKKEKDMEKVVSQVVTLQENILAPVAVEPQELEPGEFTPQPLLEYYRLKQAAFWGLPLIIASLLTYLAGDIHPMLFLLPFALWIAGKSIYNEGEGYSYQRSLRYQERQSIGDRIKEEESYGVKLFTGDIVLQRSLSAKAPYFFVGPFLAFFPVLYLSVESAEVYGGVVVRLVGGLSTAFLIWHFVRHYVLDSVKFPNLHYDGPKWYSTEKYPKAEKSLLRPTWIVAEDEESKTRYYLPAAALSIEGERGSYYGFYPDAKGELGASFDIPLRMMKGYYLSSKLPGFLQERERAEKAANNSMEKENICTLNDILTTVKTIQG